MQGIAISLIGGSISTTAIIIGFIILGISVLAMLYSLYNFRWRAAHIRNQGEARYDDVWGPMCLFVLMTIAVLTNMGYMIYLRLTTNSEGFAYDANYYH